MRLGLGLLVGAVLLLEGAVTAQSDVPVGHRLTDAQAPDASWISWREHIVDGPLMSGLPITGGDGLIMANMDGDGREDIVSVHESDTEYDGVPDGYVRIAFAGGGPDNWVNRSVAEGALAGSPEDVAAADFDGDGRLDLIVASELGHLLYLQNPGDDARTAPWPHLILPMTRERGAHIRVFAADLNGDGRPEAISANKGEQTNSATPALPRPISVMWPAGDPLDPAAWREKVLGRYGTPRQSYPIDIDRDGDIDVIGGSRFERRMILFENVGRETLDFVERPITIERGRSEGFNLAIEDLDGDGRLDIVTAAENVLVWLRQPESLDQVWALHENGSFLPDSMTGFVLADIDADGDLDVFAGSYSRGMRDRDDPAITPQDRLGPLGWFANPGDPSETWQPHRVSRRVRGLFDKFVARDIDGDGDMDFVGTRGNSNQFDGVFWLEQVRTNEPGRVFIPARDDDSREMPPALGGSLVEGPLSRKSRDEPRAVRQNP